MTNVGSAVSAVWSWILDNLVFLNLVLTIGIIFFQRRDPKSVWTWLLAIYFIPVFGVVFYLLFGQNLKKSRMFRVKGVEDRLNFPIRHQEQLLKQSGEYEAGQGDAIARDYASLILYNLETSGSVLTANRQVRIFTDGQAKFEDLRREMRRARRFIHIQYYIIKKDELFDSIVPILIEKVREGVEVRILYDGMGGRFMPKGRWEQLRAAGVKVGAFFPPFLGWLNLRVNYRNHRKIVVIDGKVGYVGGFNIGREYIGMDPKFGYWRDTHLKIYGDAVISLQVRFAQDWNYACKENLFQHAEYFDIPHSINEERKKLLEGRRQPLGIQIISSGPDARDRQIRNNYLELFYKAKHHIYIQTPYFVPDDAVLSALQVAAKSGVDVRLMIPCKPDHPFVYWATYSYVGDLLAAGARCYTYENGFLHAKGVMADGRVCSYGTANMDIRSFELNFEVNAVIFDEETTQELENIFLEDLNCCREITMDIYRRRSLIIRAKEQCSRLLSPLL